MGCSPLPAVIGTVPSVRPTPATVGCRRAVGNCCPLPMCTWSSPFLTGSPLSPCRTRSSSTICCSRLVPRRCSKWHAIPSIWARKSASSVWLHTWNQKLEHHPHLHCVVPAGGLSPDHRRWIHPRYRFFLPRKVLARVFRG